MMMRVLSVHMPTFDDDGHSFGSEAVFLVYIRRFGGVALKGIHSILTLWSIRHMKILAWLHGVKLVTEQNLLVPKDL